MSRHDIPASVKAVIETAMQQRVIDILDVYEMATEFGQNWRGLVDRICECAFAQRHSGGHGDVVRAAEEFWKSAA